MRYIIEFNTASPLRDDAGEAVYKALVSVLGSVGDFRIVRDGATFIGYFKGADQPIMWRSRWRKVRLEVKRTPDPAPLSASPSKYALNLLLDIFSRIS